MITLHSLGLAIMVGLSIVLSLRVLGWFDSFPFRSLHALLKVAWIGLIVNTLSGASLFMYQATTYVTEGIFLTKMAMVFVGAILVAVQQGMIRTALATGGGAIDEASPSLKTVALLTITAWTIAMVSGRLIAYL